MPELQLKIAKNTDDGVFGKAISNFNKVLYSSGGGFYNIVINTKRNNIVKLFSNYKNATTIADEGKRSQVTAKYEKAYENYINMLEKYLTEIGKNEKFLKNYRSALSMAIALVAMCFTNFALDAPLTIFLTNMLNQTTKPKEQEVNNG